MLASVAAYALLPWLVWSGVQGTSLWMFTAMWFASYGLLFGAARQWLAQETGHRSGRSAMLADLRAAKPRLLGVLALCQLSWLLFAAALAFADPAVATAIFESWPLLFGLITASRTWGRLMLADDAPEPSHSGISTAPMLLMLTVGSASVALVILSDAESLSWSQRAPLGILLAFAAAVAGGVGAAAQQAVGKMQRTGHVRSMTAVSASGNAVAQMLTVPLLIAVAFVTAEVALTARGVMFAVAAAGVHLMGNWCLHHANHLAREQRGRAAAGINSLYYMVPVGALLLLVAVGASSIARPVLLAIGVTGIVVANMALHMRSPHLWR